MITCSFENGNKAFLRHVAADALVLRGQEILLVKRASKLIEGGKWGLAGGYMDRDETIRETVEREVLEETGYKVENITLFKIIDNPNRPGEDRQNIAFVFFCHALDKVGQADNESDEQRWFDLSALPPESEMAFDHAASIRDYQEYLKSSGSWPLFK